MAHILIVEDDLVLAQLHQQALTFVGHTVDLVYDGESAITYLSEMRPDLILLDMHLPKLSGYEIITQIRQNPDLADLKIVGLSASSVAPTMPQAREADLMLMKPISIVELRRLIARLAGEAAP